MRTTSSRKNTVAILSVLTMWYVVGCDGRNGSGTPAEEVNFHTYDINAYPMDKVVCDPTGGGSGGTSPQQGIKGQLFYKSSDQLRYYKAEDYIKHTTQSPVDLFFSEMFVPTRMFTAGFSTQTSGVLKDDQGQQLIEFFGLKMNTTIRLAPNDAEGVYEFALLSDDGAVMKIKENGAWREIVANDGDHPTKLGCSSSRITMTRDTALEAEVLYYQGPRFHISNVLLWRKLADGVNAGQDLRCGVSGNEYWFNPNNNSRPTVEFSNLFNRGWNVVSQGNFYLPREADESTQYNPCSPGTNPTITNFRVTEVTANEVFVAWTTDIPSTSQALVVNIATGDSRLTATDNILRTNHSIQISGLVSQTSYSIQGVAVSEDLGRAISAPIELTTP